MNSTDHFRRVYDNKIKLVPITHANFAYVKRLRKIFKRKPATNVQFSYSL